MPSTPSTAWRMGRARDGGVGVALVISMLACGGSAGAASVMDAAVVMVAAWDSVVVMFFWVG
ncbi:hypothetical protein CIW51_10075 [Mycolicibacterium sp. P9-22]|nr:hypothetical protein CIW51_10075 [Mycolicibacterium sp. P9-22]